LFFGKIPLTLIASSKSKWIKLIQRLEELHNHPLIDNVSPPIARQPKMPSNNTELALEELSIVMEVVLEVKLDSINMVNKIIRHQVVEILSWVVQMFKIGDFLKSRTDSARQPTVVWVVAAISLTWVAETDLYNVVIDYALLFKI
jgi:hypothetical protein